MFTREIEFSLRELMHLKKVVLGGGGAQMFLTTLVGMLVGFAMALSSTAVRIKSFRDMGQLDSPGARMALGVAIFQDLAVIFFMVVLPSLAGDGADGMGSVFFALGKGGSS